MLTRWSNWGFREDPFAALETLRHEMNRLLGEHGRGWGSLPGLLPGLLQSMPMGPVRASWPRVDLFDVGADLMVRVELPGFKEDAIEVNLHEGTLTLKGKRPDDAPEGYTVHRRERGEISFTRAFSLPYKVEPEQAKATLKDGVLLLTIRKSEDVQPRQIKVIAS